MKCSRCSSENVYITMENTKSTTQKSGNSLAKKAAHGLVRGTAAMATLGVSNLFIPKHLEGKEKTKNKLEKFAICQDCGYSWKVK